MRAWEEIPGQSGGEQEKLRLKRLERMRESTRLKGMEMMPMREWPRVAVRKVRKMRRVLMISPRRGGDRGAVVNLTLKQEQEMTPRRTFGK